MTRIPANDIGLPLKALGDMLSNMSAWQTWTGTASAATALAKIFFYGEPFANVPSVFAVIDLLDGGWTAEKGAEGGNNEYRHFGTISLSFYSDTPTEDQDSLGDAVNNFMNTVGGVIEEMRDSGRTYLNCRRFQLAQRGIRSALVKTGQNSLVAEFAIDWSSS